MYKSGILKVTRSFLFCFVLFCFKHSYKKTGVSLVVQLVKNPPAMRENWVWFLHLEDPLEKGKATQFSGLENSMDREARQSTVHVVTKSWTWLSGFSEKSMAPHSSTLAWKIPWTSLHKRTNCPSSEKWNESHLVVSDCLWPNGL